ncbi:hypothetical protein MLD38_007138 [Melastoma candidum]|uniref:Uncharacterized protein n=1 Tax=Melastoma candidum TaxID=119954 RepID=A0ACB9RQN9_9MYRT|nr:hypothetical protein MLD38_007138 [Melastoma candidum]
MDAVKSFKGYGKVDELEQRDFARNTRRRFLVLVFLLIVLVGIIAAVAATVVHLRRKASDDDGGSSTPSSGLTPASSLKAVCSVTQYPDSCFSSISTLNAGNSTDPEQLFLLSLRVVADELTKVADLPSRLVAQAAGTIGDGVKMVLTNVCLPMLQDAADAVTESVSSLNSTGQVGKFLLNASGIGDLRTWLSAAMTNHETCIDALTEINATELADSIHSATLNSTQFMSNSLAIVTKIITLLAELNIPIHRRLLSSNDHAAEFPSWVGRRDRNLLAAGVKPDVTVAKDGSGNYRTISEAVAAAPVKNKTGRFVIYIKAGTYLENVDIGKNAWNVMMYGDGKTRTVVSGSLNFADGTPTFKTATFAVTGRGFMARDMGFVNTAGAAKHQAVALRREWLPQSSVTYGSSL